MIRPAQPLTASTGSAANPALAHGVSLIEALVALAIMSFGMLALVGVQANLRYNADVARQRTEATRLAIDDAESLRFFNNVAPLAAQVCQTPPPPAPLPACVPNQAYDSWDELAGRTAANLNTPGNTANTHFGLTRTLNTVSDVMPGIAAFDAAAMKVTEVRIEWGDRANSMHSATMDSIVSAVSPALSARLLMATPTAAPSRRAGRHTSIPVTARDLGDGRSAYKPFSQGTTVWVLNNTTGYVTSLCTGVTAAQAAITLGDLSTCSNVTGRLVTGVVRFDGGAAVSAAVAESPAGPALPLDSSQPLRFSTVAAHAAVNQSSAPVCVADNPPDPATAALRSAVAYACLIFPSDSTGWGGRLDLVAGTSYPDGSPASWNIGAAATDYRVCRYTTATTDYTANANHPATYCQVTDSTCSSRVTQSLANQNFLIIKATNSCPTDGPINPAGGDLVNSNTLAHQP